MTDPEQIRATLELLFPAGGIVELRAPKAQHNGTTAVLAGYFTDFNLLATAAGRIHAPGIYVTLNKLDGSLLNRAPNKLIWAKRTTGDGEVTRRINMLVDIDIDRPANTSTTDDEHTAAIALARHIADELDNEGWPAPLIGDSGNGAHLIYAIDLPANDGGLVQRVLNALARRFDSGKLKIDRSVFNASRISKLYGTVAAKGPNTPDRPHRLARILSAPSVLEPLPVDLLERLAGPAPQKPNEPPAENKTTVEEVTAFLAKHKLKVKFNKPLGDKTVLALERCPFNPEHGAGGESSVIVYSDGGVHYKCWHDHCLGKTWGDILNRYTEPPTEGTNRIIKTSFRFIPPSELRRLLDQSFIIKPFIPRNAFVVVYGRRGHGKTFLTLGWSLSVATGFPWLKHETTPGKVLYVATEGLAGYKKRLAAWEEASGSTVADDAFRFLPDGLNLMDDSNVQAFIHAVEEFSPSVIVVDTLARTLIGGDENSARDMGLAVRNVDEIRTATGATLVLVHHAGKGENATLRGSSALDAAADVVIRVESEDGSEFIDLISEKVKDFEPFETVHLVRKVVTICETGQTSCILESSESHWTGLLDSEAKVFNCLTESSLDGGLSKSEWRDLARVPRSTFYLAVNALLKRGYVKTEGRGNCKKYQVAAAFSGGAVQ